MNQLSNSDRCRVLACLVEGNSIRATVRITGICNPFHQFPDPRQHPPQQQLKQNGVSL